MKQENNIRNPEKRKEKPNYTARRVGAAVLLTLSILGTVKVGEIIRDGVNDIKEYMDRPYESPYEYSGQKLYLVEPNDGVWRAAEKVDNVESVDIRIVIDDIELMPENAIVLSDGLQPGEVLVIPQSVKKK